MLTKLGKELGKARADKGFSLDVAAGSAKISGAYLHKLEKGVVNNPSPRVLARLAATLEVPYLRLMELAGYFDEAQLAEAQLRQRVPKPHPLAGQQLTASEWKLVGAFVKKLLRERKQKPKRGGSGS